MIAHSSRGSRRQRIFFRASRYLLATFLALCIVPPQSAYSQEEVSCKEVLSSPLFQSIISRTENRSPAELATDRAGRELLGKRCSIEDLEDYFFSAGWDFERKSTNPGERSYGAPPGFRYTEMYRFCKKSRDIMNLFIRKCTHAISVHLFDGKISHISSGAVK